MKKLFAGLLIILILVMGISVLNAGCTEQPKKVHLVMGYIPNVQFAPWYVALEKGFFQEAGLDVTMDYGKVNDVMRLLAAGKIDFAIAGGDEVIVARGQGIPVSYSMALYARFPAVIVSLADQQITSPVDLKGKSIGIPGFYGTNYIAIKAVLAGAGLKENEVTIRPIGYTQVASLSERKVDAIVGFANNEPVQLRQQGLDINVINCDQYFDLVGHGVVTGSKAQKDPTLTRAFIQATLKGMEYALAHPEETMQICQQYIPELDATNSPVQYQVLLESMQLWQSPTTQKHGLGYSAPQAWAKSQQLMYGWGMIPQTSPVEDLVTNQFLR